MDMCDIGLHDIIRERGSLSEVEAKKIMSQLLKALNHCHSMGIVHRDIKAQNIMIVFLNRNNQNCEMGKLSNNPNEDPWHIKLIDWGIACKLKKGTKLSEKSGSPLYMAPEVLQGLYDNKCDVWSCGVLLYYMLTGSFPFNGNSMKDLFWNTKFKILNFDNEFWSNFSSECISFLK
jgi:calcium-dependent protein kinase